MSLVETACKFANGWWKNIINCLWLIWLFLLFFKKVVETFLKVVNSWWIAACKLGYPPLFTICKKVVDSLLKCFSTIVDTLLKGFACGLHYWFDCPLAVTGPLGELSFEVKINGATKKLMKRQRHLSKYSSTHPYYLQPVSFSWDSPFSSIM